MFGVAVVEGVVAVRVRAERIGHSDDTDLGAEKHRFLGAVGEVETDGEAGLVTRVAERRNRDGKGIAGVLVVAADGYRPVGAAAVGDRDPRAVADQCRGGAGLDHAAVVGHDDAEGARLVGIERAVRAAEAEAGRFVGGAVNDDRHQRGPGAGVRGRRDDEGQCMAVGSVGGEADQEGLLAPRRTAGGDVAEGRSAVQHRDVGVVAAEGRRDRVGRCRTSIGQIDVQLDGFARIDQPVAVAGAGARAVIVDAVLGHIQIIAEAAQGQASPVGQPVVVGDRDQQLAAGMVGYLQHADAVGVGVADSQDLVLLEQRYPGVHQRAAARFFDREKYRGHAHRQLRRMVHRQRGREIGPHVGRRITHQVAPYRPDLHDVRFTDGVVGVHVQLAVGKRVAEAMVARDEGAFEDAGEQAVVVPGVRADGRHADGARGAAVAIAQEILGHGVIVGVGERAGIAGDEDGQRQLVAVAQRRDVPVGEAARAAQSPVGGHGGALVDAAVHLTCEIAAPDRVDITVALGEQLVLDPLGDGDAALSRRGGVGRQTGALEPLPVAQWRIGLVGDDLVDDVLELVVVLVGEAADEDIRKHVIARQHRIVVIAFAVETGQGLAPGDHPRAAHAFADQHDVFQRDFPGFIGGQNIVEDVGSRVADLARRLQDHVVSLPLPPLDQGCQGGACGFMAVGEDHQIGAGPRVHVAAIEIQGLCFQQAGERPGQQPIAGPIRLAATEDHLRRHPVGDLDLAAVGVVAERAESDGHNLYVTYQRRWSQFDGRLLRRGGPPAAAELAVEIVAGCVPQGGDIHSG